MVFYTCESFHFITLKFCPGPNEEREHRNGSKQGHRSSRLDAFGKMTQVPRRHTAYGDRYPQGIPCCRIGGHNVAPSQCPIKVLLTVVLPLFLGPTWWKSCLRKRWTRRLTGGGRCNLAYSVMLGFFQFRDVFF